MNKDLIAWNEALKEGFEAGVEAERERIIELLEDNYWHYLVNGGKEHIAGCLGCQQIAIIKGEK